MSSRKTVAMVTLGCAKNQVDSEVMLGNLVSRGFSPISELSDAEIIVVNTCAFLEAAVSESVDRILELAKYKRNGCCRHLVVAGCLVERYRGELRDALPEVDQFLSTDELFRVGLEDKISNQYLDEQREPRFLYDHTMPRVRNAGEVSAYVKIAEGCSRPCSFCIIPRLRGRFRSRSLSSVRAEVEALLRDGVREITLVAQDSTSYGTEHYADSQPKPGLSDLLKTLDSLDIDVEQYWVRLMYAFPSGVTEELLDVIRDASSVCDYLDIPLQHISDGVLKRMRRPMGESKTRSLIEKIRLGYPEISLRTTFLVGFPGESEEDIRGLERFIQEGHFTHVGVFSYSQEDRAESYGFSDQIDEQLRSERRERIMLCQQEVMQARNRKRIGSRERVLIEAYHPDSELLINGRTEWQAVDTDGQVIINDFEESILTEDGSFSPGSVLGRFGEVEISDTAAYDLIGRLVAVE